ncbi:MAG: carboxypeptidase-like regulatory domain-containing protein [Planctomycetota bacterium]
MSHSHLPRSLFATLALAAAASPLAAQSLSGRIVDPQSVPIAGITVDPGHGAATAVSDSAGLFTITGLQVRTYDVEYRPSQGAPWCGSLVATPVSGATNVGDVVLLPGFTVAGTAVNAANAPIPGGNVNVYDQAGTKLFTPHDGTVATGAFMVTVPAGTWDVHIVPPTASLLVTRVYNDLVAAAPVNLGNVTLATGYPVSGTVVDSVSSVPVGSTKIVARNALTGEAIPLTNNTANSFGAFSLILPYGIVDLDFEPPLGNSHVARRVFGAFVLGTTALGQVRLQNGVFVSGSVGSAGGPVDNADIDVFAADGHKLFLAHDKTLANGAFSVAVPAGGTYTVRVEPPVAAGLAGHLSAPTPVNAATSLPAIVLPTGVAVSGTISGPQGPEAGANLNFFDQNGVELVTVGDHTDANGHYATFVPAGTWRIDVQGRQGNRGRPVTTTGIAIAGATTWNLTLPQKQLVADVTGFGTPTLLQGGLLPLNPSLEGLVAPSVSAVLDVVVALPGGTEIPVMPSIPLGVIPFPLHLVGVWVPIPVVPTTALGKPLDFVMRYRDPVTNAVLDAAHTSFVVQ